jgi:superoxide dismutase, Fe-Mn family
MSANPQNTHTLPALPYAYDALEPHIDARTMEIHHTKHHQAYIDKLNAALDGLPELQAMPIEELLRNISKVPEDKRQAVINNGGGHANHTALWQWMAPNAGGEPTGSLAEAINTTFGGFEQFKEQFAAQGVNRFGSGWAWLGFDATGKLHLGSTQNQDSPLMQGHRPILGLDVWEHAYYLNYQNRRPDYIKAWWNVVNWPRVQELFDSAK